MPPANVPTAAPSTYRGERTRHERHRTLRIARTGVVPGGRPGGQHQRRRSSPGTAHPRAVPLSRRIAIALGAMAVVLAGWTGWLGGALPAHHVEENWNVAWIGFDAFLTVCIASTAWLAWRRSPWISLSACATAVALLVDAWFDCLTAGTHREYLGSVALALLAELPLAFALLWLAVVAARRSFGRAGEAAQALASPRT